MSCFRLLAAVVWHLLALIALAASAQVASAQVTPTQPRHIAAELIAESPVPAGGTVMLAIHFRPEPGWHGYWLNPGDAGFGMSLDWALPPGVKVGEPRYPVPETLLISGLMNHIYEHEYAVLVPLTLPAGFTRGVRVPIAVEAQWLACTDTVCVPERARLETLVEVAPAYAADDRFDGWRARLPAPLDAQGRFALTGNKLTVAIPLPAALPLENPHFFAGQDRIMAYAAPQKFRRAGDTLVIEMDRAKAAPAIPSTVSGVLRLDSAGNGLEVTAVPGPVPAGGIPVLPVDAPTIPALPLLLLAALAGGLLLNIMPCVFPILSLKALSLARAGESGAHARSEGLAYTAGVVLACTGLGALMLALRAGGEEIGWAFQLQEPGVVAALLLVAVAITANFLGLFEFAVPGFAGGGSPQSAFATGLLAAFAATPCTGPFMAAAMGAALLLPPLPALALFATLGLGLTLPFLAIAFVPALRARLPRPGPWMVRFRRWMALPMGLTALALAWLASRLGGTAFAVACAVLALMLVALLAWIGVRQRSGRAAALLAGVGAAIIIAGGAVVLPRLESAAPADHTGILPVRAFSADALADARASGKPVFVWLTADWCLTCKVNERVAIEREDVRDAFARAGVQVLRGDWTRRDPAITRYLAAQGAAGVPLYVWYPAKSGAPEQLPQLLTPTSLTTLADNSAR